MKKHKENKPYNPSGENSFKKDFIMLPQNFTFCFCIFHITENKVGEKKYSKNHLCIDKAGFLK